MEDWREKFDTKLAILMGNRAEAEVIAADVAEILHHFGQEYSPEQVRKMTTEELIGLKDECLGTHVLEAMLRNRAKVMFHYEKQDLVMEAWDVFHNFNGSSMSRKDFIIIVLIGIALVAVPFVFRALDHRRSDEYIRGFEVNEKPWQRNSPCIRWARALALLRRRCRSSWMRKLAKV